MKKYVLILSLIVSTNIVAQESKSIILNGPEDWKYEKINFPLDFAPEIAYEGFEELRFATGMFDRSSPTYFTYVFAISLDEKTKLKKKEIAQFLSKYYKGLCAAVAKSKKQSIDTSKITVTLKRSRKVESSSGKNYTAQVLFFDTFNDGEKVLLHMELEIIIDKEAKKSYMLALVSPELQSTIWKKLYEIREKARTKINGEK